jgi:hypothetical protein
MAELVRVIEAVAKGDLSERIDAEIGQRELPATRGH